MTTQDPPPPDPTPAAPPPPPEPPTHVQQTRSNWTLGRVVGMILASIAALIGIGLLLGGIAAMVVHGIARDGDGFYTSPDETLRSPGFAITSEQIDLDDDVVDDLPDDLLGTLRVRAAGLGGRPIFLGIGPSVQVERYLAGVARTAVVDFRRGEPVYRDFPGRAPRGAPAQQRFWVASDSGPGEREINWDPDQGVWTLVAMNANGSRGVGVEADIGAKIGWLIWVGLGLTLVGLIVGVTAIALIIHISRRAARDPVPVSPA